MGRMKYLACSIFFATLCACNSNSITEKTMHQPPIKPGLLLDKDSEYGKWWVGQPAIFRLSDELVLAIPPQHQQFWKQRNQVVRAPADYKRLPKGGQIGFEMFMPDFSGYTPENYEVEFHQDKVEIGWVMPSDPKQMKPGAPGRHVPNMLSRLAESTIDLNLYEEKFGLKCYEPKPRPSETLLCYGIRDASTGEQIYLRIMHPTSGNTFVTNPQMQARYFSSKYGGTEILWSAHMKHFEHWQKIDQQIWNYIDQWNLVKPTTINNSK
jgi:hypothetical protein